MDQPAPPFLFAAQVLHRAGGPLYRQAAERLRAAIGQAPPGAELPREADMAEAFGVSLITIRHALRELEGEGLIRKRAAKTAVVADLVPRALNSLDDIIAATRDARLEISSWRPRRSAEAAQAFALAPHIACPCLQGRLLVHERPLSTIDIFFPPDIGEQLARADFDDVVVFRSVERRLGIRLAGARITVGAERADARLARALEYEEGAPVLTSRMLYLDTSERPVELTIARHRGDSYRLSYAFPAR